MKKTIEKADLDRDGLSKFHGSMLSLEIYIYRAKEVCYLLQSACFAYASQEHEARCGQPCQANS